VVLFEPPISMIQRDMPELYSVMNERDVVVCERCAIADTPVSRLRGLLGRHELDADEGLLLRPESSIHTWFMRFPIDALFLEADLTLEPFAESDTNVMLLLRNGADAQVVFGRGPLSAASRTISAMSELDVGVSAVVLSDDEQRKAG
jgi:uncharacterized protein DUF192 probably involved in sugar metabolism